MRAALLILLAACIDAEEEIPMQCRHEKCRYVGRFQFDEDRYEVDGHELWIMYGNPGGYFRINCIGSMVLGSPAMPRAVHPLTVWDLNVANCHLGTNDSLAEKLAEINVSMEFSDVNATAPRGNLTIENFQTTPPLTARYFTGLENLAKLDIYGYTQAEAERNFLLSLQRLRMLKIKDVTLPDGELEIPSSLRHLSLIHTGVNKLSKSVYSSPSLLELIIQSKTALDAVKVPPELRLLNLQSPATSLRLDAIPMLQRITLSHWTELHPPQLTRCDNLLKIHLSAPALETLPYGWLANCSNLEDLVIEHARNLITLPQRLFGSSQFNLKRVAFKNGSLETLSEGQFDEATEIQTLELDGNRLRSIPRGTLPNLSIKELDLSSNDLDSSVLEIVSPCHWMRTLNLAFNPRLGDFCEVSDHSVISELGWIKILRLKKTNVTRICRDWREKFSYLEKLDLSYSSVSKLSFEDLQFKRSISGAEVLLQGSPLVSLEMTRDQFLKAKRTPTSGAFIRLDPSSEFVCDCRMYWTRRTLDNSPHSLDRISELRCTGGISLRDLAPEELLCEGSDDCTAAGLPSECACSERPDDDPSQENQLVRVRCEGAALQHVPHFLPNSTNNFYELLLAHNRIKELQVDDLHNVKGLDLRNNYIKTVNEETAITLAFMNGTLRLADNPLDCECTAAPLLQALHGRSFGSTDLSNITCGDGRSLYDVSVAECPPSILWLAGGLLAIFALTVAVIIYLASRQRRFFVKAVLHRWGCLWISKTTEEERRYDAFVTFSHKDEALVLELAARLEPPYRLCLHYRDWVPGLRIPDQIIESVRESHRTVALVSRHFLASTWARAEFREAHEAAMLEARPRLIVVLLEEPSSLPLDDQLQRYIASHTYLRWGEPWFYSKLAVALPRPRHPHDNGDMPFAHITSPLPHLPALPQPTKPAIKNRPSDVGGDRSPDPRPTPTVFTISGSAMELSPVA